MKSGSGGPAMTGSRRMEVGACLPQIEASKKKHSCPKRYPLAKRQKRSPEADLFTEYQRMKDAFDQ